jgi:hypothetical protein
MTVKYSGCRYDSVVFVNVSERFKLWIQELWTFMMNEILNNISVHCPSGNHPTFTNYPIKDDEFRVKLATNRNAPQALTSIVTKENELVDPSNVFANSLMTPILRVYYHLDRNNDFGLTFVMIKAIYEPGPVPLTLMPTDLWEIDEEKN